MSCEKACYGYGNPVGMVLVLFILLVIIVGAFWI
nr:YjcZ family sporulation protein [Paenibacillus dakarensis]